MKGISLHILLYSQVLLKLKFSGNWEPGDTVSHSISQKQLRYSKGEQRCQEEHDDSPTVHSPKPGTFRSKLYRAEKLPRFKRKLSCQHYPPNQHWSDQKADQINQEAYSKWRKFCSNLTYMLLNWFNCSVLLLNEMSHLQLVNSPFLGNCHESVKNAQNF